MAGVITEQRRGTQHVRILHFTAAGDSVDGSVPDYVVQETFAGRIIRLVTNSGTLTSASASASASVSPSSSASASLSPSASPSRSQSLSASASTSPSASPSPTLAPPTDNWDVQLLDQHGLDVLQTLGLNRDRAVTEEVSIVYSGSSVHLAVSDADVLTLRVGGNTDASAVMNIYMYYASGY